VTLPWQWAPRAGRPSESNLPAARSGVLTGDVGYWAGVWRDDGSDDGYGNACVPRGLAAILSPVRTMTATIGRDG
jgi:hypothetical protein